jgi:hypothetical protein
LILNNQEKEIVVVKLLNEGKATREIAQLAHISLRDICKIRKKVTGDYEFQETAEQMFAQKLKEKSHYAQCFQMLKDGKSLIDIVIELDMEADIIKNHYSDYLDLRNMKNLESIYKDIKNDFSLFVHLYKRIKKEELNKQDITEILENQKELKDLENRVRLFNEHIGDLQSQKLQLENEIVEKERFLKIN